MYLGSLESSLPGTWDIQELGRLTPTTRAWERAERNEAVRSHYFYSFSNKTCVGQHAKAITGLASQNRHELYILHIGVHIHLRWFPHLLHQIICYLFPFGRAVRSLPPKREKGVQNGATPILPLPIA